MLDKADSQKSTVSTDPMELWKRWNETTSKVWLSAVQNSTEATTNSYGLYRSWIQSVGESVSKAQEPLNVNPFQMMSARDAWKTWFDATMEIWRKAVQTSGDPLGLTRQWLSMMEEAQQKLLAGTPLQTDPFTLFKEWYDATSDQWSKAVEETLSSQQFLESTRPLLESYASISLAFRRANEEYFKRLQLPTTSDIANVAQLVINLEEKIDKTEDVLENFEDSFAHLATVEAVTALEQRLDHVATNETVASLEQRLSQMATTEEVASLQQQLQQMATTETVSGLAQRLNQVESKLDKVLAALKKLDGPSRKTQKKNASQQEVQE